MLCVESDAAPRRFGFRYLSLFERDLKKTVIFAVLVKRPMSVKFDSLRLATSLLLGFGRAKLRQAGAKLGATKQVDISRTESRMSIHYLR